MTKFDNLFSKLKGKKIAVIGIGISNRPLLNLLHKFGACITVHDKKSEHDIPDFQVLKSMNIDFKLGTDYLTDLNGFDYIFRSPGIRPDIPEFENAQRSGSILTSEMECFFEVCPCPIIAVTGSDGKTTTTTLISKILQHAGYTCHLGGNIGTPLLDKVPDMKDTDFAVVELSSFQLFSMKRSPTVAVITNLSPNHLDIHKNMEEYKNAKKNIFIYQTKNDLLILNADNQYTPEFEKESVSNVVKFSSKSSLEHGFFIKDNCIVFNDVTATQRIVNLSDIIIPGIHNVENYMAAAAATMRFCEFRNVENIAKTFCGVEHRIELVRCIDGVRYYNDSIGSSPSRTIAGLRSFQSPVILIAGGYDKHIPFEPLADEINLPSSCVKEVILTGDTSKKIESAIKNNLNYSSRNVPIIICDTLDCALYTAKQHAVSGDNIVMSPACASFDRYKNFEERGNVFKNLVNSL